MRVNTILVPSDFSPAAEAALSVATEFAKQMSAQIVILNACRIEIPYVFSVEGSFSFPPGFLEEVRSETAAKVEQLAREVSEKEGLDVRGIAVLEPAETAILESAESLPADMIVMGTRGLTGLKHVALGSVAERIVRLAPCPVMTVSAST